MALLLGPQLGYTEHEELLFHGTTAREGHFTLKRTFTNSQHWVPGQKVVAKEPLVDPTKIVLPPLNINLGLMKNFVEALNTDGESFQWLR